MSVAIGWLRASTSLSVQFVEEGRHVVVGCCFDGRMQGSLETHGRCAGRAESGVEVIESVQRTRNAAREMLCTGTGQQNAAMAISTQAMVAKANE